MITIRNADGTVAKSIPEGVVELTTDTGELTHVLIVRGNQTTIIEPGDAQLKTHAQVFGLPVVGSFSSITG